MIFTNLALNLSWRFTFSQQELTEGDNAKIYLIIGTFEQPDSDS
jgi:hypothetical protein